MTQIQLPPKETTFLYFLFSTPWIKAATLCTMVTMLALTLVAVMDEGQTDISNWVSNRISDFTWSTGTPSYSLK